MTREERERALAETRRLLAEPTVRRTVEEPPVEDGMSKWKREGDEAEAREAAERERRRAAERAATRAAAAPAVDPLHVAPVIIDTMGQALAMERQLHRDEREKELAPLRREVAELRGQVSALLALLQGKAADVVTLPRKHA